MDTVVTGGVIVDGSGAPGREGTLRFKDGVIQEINWGSGTCGLQGEEQIDARGMVVSPGFIDVHGHSEFTLLADPSAESRVRQGVTSEVIGNCGLSGGPLEGAYREHREADLQEFSLRDEWRTLGEFLHVLESRTPAMNVATLAGHGNIRGAVLGFEARRPTEAELNRMQRLLGESIRDGAIGLSAGLVYPPGVFGDREELVCLARIVARAGGVCAFHMRSEGDELLEAVDEVLAVGVGARAAVHISHLKTSGEENWHKLDALMDRVDEAKKAGMALSADRYPYTASSTDLDSVLPPWVFEGGKDEALARIGVNAPDRAAILEGLRKSRWENHWDAITVTSVASTENRWVEGRTIEEICRRSSVPAPETVLGLLETERFRVGAVFHVMSEENLRRILCRPDVCIGSDSAARSSTGVTATGKPHPRGFGSFVRVLGDCVRDRGWLELEEAIRKMTFLPASLFGLKRRGLLQPFYAADLVIFDPEQVADGSTYEMPFLSPQGVRDVWVNGVRVLEGEKPTGRRGGRILRGGN